ncbi:MAG: HEAT repeat domain-containing protein [Deltaproteobacteria bacterium]|nr:HEAT repeat domain-containing protein [Deltaproteobacteria bacterium]
MLAVQILFFIIGVSFFLIFSIFLVIILRRFRRNMKYERFDIARNKFAPLVAALVSENNQTDINLLQKHNDPIEWMAIEELLLKTFEVSSPDVRKRLLPYFEKLGYVDDYIHTIKHGNKWRRALAAEKLGRLRWHKATPWLIELLNDKSRDVRNMAVHSLGLIRDQDAIPHIIASIKRAVGSHEDISLRIAKSSLICYGEVIIPFLIPELKNPIWQVRAVAVEILGETANTAMIQSITDMLKDPEPDIRAKAAKVLGKIGDSSSVQPLLQIIEDPVWIIRLHAVRALGLIGNTDAIEKLKGRLMDSNWQVRRAAAEAISVMGDYAIPVWSGILLNSADKYAKEQVLEELQRTGVIDGWVNFSLINEKGNINDEIEMLLYVIGVIGGLSPLLRGMNSENPLIRQRIAKILGRIGNSRAINVLEHVVRQDNNPVVREEAVKAIKALHETSQPVSQISSDRQEVDRHG